MVKLAKKINVKEYVSDNVIDLSMSNLTDVPAKEIAAFKRCNTLDLSRNKIVELPKTFGLLTHLTRLDLSSNQIKMLPAEIGLLVNLRHFDVYNNEMVHLPLEMSKLKQLRYLDVKGNPLSEAIRNVIGPCLTNIECNKAARKMVEFLTTVKLKVDSDRLLLKQNQLVAAAEKESNTIGDTEIGDSELVTVQPEPQKAAKKPKPLSKKMKKLLEENSIENQPKNVSGQSAEGKQQQRQSTIRSAILTIVLIILLPLLAIGLYQRYDTDGERTKQLVHQYVPSAYQSNVLLVLAHLRQNAANYGKWIQTFWHENNDVSI